VSYVTQIQTSSELGFCASGGLGTERTNIASTEAISACPLNRPSIDLRPDIICANSSRRPVGRRMENAGIQPFVGC
jgi:hypothetical protein